MVRRHGAACRFRAGSCAHTVRRRFFISMRFFSLRLPFGRYIHYARGRKLGESRPAYAKGLIHYDPGKRLTGKMVRSFFGEPNHYDRQGKSVGYSRYESRNKLVHYDRQGCRIGYTYSIFRVFYVHHCREQMYRSLFTDTNRRKYHGYF